MSKISNLSDIDFIITWVDSSDPSWQNDFNKYRDDNTHICRYRDLGTLRYMFRSFDEFTPWVRKIHFVTYGHTPSWLKLSHPKINIVRHEDILPEKALPIFTGCTIELGLGNICDLSEKFVYFNDDMFMIKPTSVDRFFYKNLPKDFFQVGILYHNSQFSHMIHETMSLISRSFLTKDVFTMKMIPKVFNMRYGIVPNLRTFLSLIVSRNISRIMEYHHPQPHLKRNFNDVCRIYMDEIEKVKKHRFRYLNSLNQYIFRYWGLINGRFYPYRPRDVFYKTISSETDILTVINELYKGKHRFICLNDVETISEDDFSALKYELKNFLNKILPNSSSFELA